MPSDEIVATSVPAPWGPVHVAASPRGIVALDQLTSVDEFAARLQARFGRPPVPLDPGRETPVAANVLRQAVDALEAFIAGDLDALDRLPIDLADRPAWDRLVLGAVRSIPPGRTASYGQVARMIGKPGAARAVGGAVGRSPIGLVIPCHRVIAGDGSIGGYGGSSWGGRQAGTELKRELLAREGVHVRAER